MSKGQKAHQATLEGLRESLQLPEAPQLEPIWLDPQVICIDGIEDEGLEADAKNMQLSIELVGIQQDIIVVADTIDMWGQDKKVYRCVAGRRRALAARLAELPGVWVKQIASTDRAALAIMTLNENLNRRAAWQQTVLKLYELLHDGRYTADRVLAMVTATTGRGKATISPYLKMAQLPEPLYLYIVQGKIAEAVAKQILTLSADKLQQLIDRAIASESIDAGVVRALIRVSVAPTVQAALLEDEDTQPAPAAEDELEAEIDRLDSRLASAAKYSKARMLLSMARKAIREA